MLAHNASRKTAMLTRPALAHALHAAADVMQNTAAVAKSPEWKGRYRQLMHDYRAAAELLDHGAKFAIKQ